jgi:hypothetical protein
LHPLPNQQGGHMLLDLHTKRTITRRTVTPVPVTAAVIATVEAMAAKEGIKGLNIRTKTGHILYDSTWTAGVDYEDDDDESYEPSSADETDDKEPLDENERAELLDEPVQTESHEEELEDNTKPPDLSDNTNDGEPSDDE